MTRVKKIALEEHFMTPGFQAYSKGFTQHIDPAVFADLGRRLADFDALRLAEDGPCGHRYHRAVADWPRRAGESDAELAVARAKQSNDFLAGQIARHPRALPAAALPMQLIPSRRARSLSAVRELRLRGSLVNGHTQGRYYDDPAYDDVAGNGCNRSTCRCICIRPMPM
ncbi:hypothetical protein ACTMU2_10465 [Cupriavidus basilensis]